MKLALLLPLPCLTSAFTTPVQHLQRTPVALSASRDNVAAAAALAVGLGLAQVAGAVTTVDQFTLPSYDSSKGVTVIDLKDEVQDVNKKTMAAAKAKREYKDDSLNKAEFDKLRAIEAEESKLFESMTKQSDADKKARIEMEKAETRANRWNTF
ncbi:hypothetical protein ACHAWO_004662 [Cyclotella atomus]|uniref:Uncharacterized protein n=1 Tax=Cyclotella atomus TaxID=382360 RepID=A0ABD3NWN9_9STRA